MSKSIKFSLLIIAFSFISEIGYSQCTGCTTTLNGFTSSQNGTYTFASSLTCFTGTSLIRNSVSFSAGASLCVSTGAVLTFTSNNYSFSDPSSTITIDVYGTLIIGQNPSWAGNMNLIVHPGATLDIQNTITLNGDIMEISNEGTFNAGTIQFSNSNAEITIVNYNSMYVNNTLNINSGTAYFKNATGAELTIGGNYNSSSTSVYVNCGTYTGKFNLNSGGKVINTGIFNVTQMDFGSSASRFENYHTVNATNSSINPTNGTIYNEGIFTFSNNATISGDGNLIGPSDNSKRGYFVWSGKAAMNSGTIGPNLNFRNTSGTSSASGMFNNVNGMSFQSGLTWGDPDPSSLPAAGCAAPDGSPSEPIPTQTSVCTGVDLTTIHPAENTVNYEWWTGNSTTRTTKISESKTLPTTNYTTAGLVYLWAVNVSTGEYSKTGAEVTVNQSPTVTIPTGTPVEYAQDDIAAPISVTGTAGSGTISAYSWYKSSYANGDESIFVITNTNSETTDIFTPSTSVVGDLYYFAIIENSNSCTDTDDVSGKVTITSTLPVDLHAQNIEHKRANTIVSWTTASEFNNDYFLIERSKNGVDFEMLGNIKGAGNSNVILSYEFVDAKPFIGVSYYRITQFDFDGKNEVFPMMVLNVEAKASELKVYPNPSTDFVNIQSETNGEISVINATGRIIYSADINSGEILKIETINMDAGMYLVKLITADNVEMQKLIVK